MTARLSDSSFRLAPRSVISVSPLSADETGTHCVISHSASTAANDSETGVATDLARLMEQFERAAEVLAPSFPGRPARPPEHQAVRALLEQLRTTSAALRALCAKAHRLEHMLAQLQRSA